MLANFGSRPQDEPNHPHDMRFLKNLQQFLREMPKKTDKTNLFQTHERNLMVLVLKKSPNLQILPGKWQSHKVIQKAVRKAKNSPFSLQFPLMRRHMYFSMIFC